MMQKQMTGLEEELRNTKLRLNESETERKNANDLLASAKRDVESKDKQIKLLISQVEAAKVYKVKLGEREASIEKLNKRIVELEDELEKTKESESHMLDSLMIQTRQIEQTKMDLEESKLEIKHLNQELNLQKSSEQEVAILKKEVRRLNQLRIETDESIAAWSAKEMGFITCINTAYEENASLTRQNNKLHEALMAAENTTRITREETSKLRDIVKQAVNESNVAKEASNIARAESSKLKDMLSKKEESLRALAQENERLVAKEAAANENLNEFKTLLTAKTEASKQCEDHHTEVFNSPDSSPQHMFSFDFDDFKGFNKDEDDHNDTFVDVDPEKFEALKGSIFDTDESPKSELRTPPKAKGHHHRSGSGHFEEADHHRSHSEHGDDKGYYLYGLYHRKKLFKKIGDLIGGKNHNHGKKEGSIEHGKEEVKEQGKEVKEQGNEVVKEQGKEVVKEEGKEVKEQGKEEVKEQGKEEAKEQSKEQGKQQVS
ncbi:uncharacterized protein LOC143634232 isoform X2 [Bidens hawaiensis]|uniref:uncharacterized protein LOC143634232 isoform X2 n=1 Tax=Bidens hawaiensis TaxID=980011 RepID=UPI0040491A1C